MGRTVYDRAINDAYLMAARTGDVRKLPVSLRNAVVADTAWGIIGNGGFQYFFENDFPGKPSYSLFVRAFRAIGAHDAAATLERAVALFPFARPERSSRKRNKFLNGFRNEGPFARLSRRIWDDKQIEPLLQAYVRQNIADFRKQKRKPGKSPKRS